MKVIYIFSFKFQQKSKEVNFPGLPPSFQRFVWQFLAAQHLSESICHVHFPVVLLVKPQADGGVKSRYE